MNNIFQHYVVGKNLYTLTVMPICEKYGLTYMEFTVLMFLANNPQFDTAAEIVKYRHLTKSHVSVSLRSLQEKGLVLGEYHEPNRKAIHLKVLDAAHSIISDGRAAQQSFGETLLSGFSEKERKQLREYMKRIDDNITKQTEVIQK